MKTVAILGGSGGLGQALAGMMSDDYHVWAPSSERVDLTELTSVKNWFNSRYTPDIDILINLAGYNHDGFIHKLDDEHEIEKMLDVNVKGSVNALAAVLPGMRKRGYGRIILASSVLVNKPVLATGLYTACKSFIDSLARSTSAENISKGITCNSLQLGYFDAGMCHRLPEQLVPGIKESIGLKRWGTIQELYQTVEYLINTEYITGQNINISGGLQ